MAMIFSALLTGFEIVVLTRWISPSPRFRAFSMFFGGLGALAGTVFGMGVIGGATQWDFLMNIMPCMLIAAALCIAFLGLLRWYAVG